MLVAKGIRTVRGPSVGSRRSRGSRSPNRGVVGRFGGERCSPLTSPVVPIRGVPLPDPSRTRSTEASRPPARVRRRVSPPRPCLLAGLTARAPGPDSVPPRQREPRASEPGTPSTDQVLLASARAAASAEPATLRSRPWVPGVGFRRLHPAPPCPGARWLGQRPLPRAFARGALHHPCAADRLLLSCRSASAARESFGPRAVGRFPSRAALALASPSRGGRRPVLSVQGESAAAFTAPHPPSGGPEGRPQTRRFRSTLVAPRLSLDRIRRVDSGLSPLRAASVALTRAAASLPLARATRFSIDSLAGADRLVRPGTSTSPRREGAAFEPRVPCRSKRSPRCARPGIHRLSPTCGQMTALPGCGLKRP